VNAASSGVTALCLAAITAVAAVAASSQRQHAAPHLALPEQVEAWPRLAGVASDPWHLDDWQRATGSRLQVVMQFRAWSHRSSLRPFLHETARRGALPMITWEPWRPAHGVNPGALQPAYSNETIAAGGQDDYIRSVARDVASTPGRVVVRYAHEMTGYWYPWHSDPAAYVAAWRRIVRIFRDQGANNAVFVWSVNGNLHQAVPDWKAQIDRYWPGAEYVDAVGMTTVRSTRKPFSVAQFGQRLAELRSYCKPVWMPEVEASLDRSQFLQDLAGFLTANPWVRGVIWSDTRTLPAAGSETAVLLGRVARSLAPTS
jgi:mannan endo-1,4-beta-mannosidase